MLIAWLSFEDGPSASTVLDKSSAAKLHPQHCSSFDSVALVGLE